MKDKTYFRLRKLDKLNPVDKLGHVSSFKVYHELQVYLEGTLVESIEEAIGGNLGLKTWY